jgi:hypothetical protein
MFDGQDLPCYMELSLHGDNSWVSCNANRLIWFPPGFRPARSTVYGNRITVGCDFGLVYILEFNARAFSINKKYSFLSNDFVSDGSRSHFDHIF